MTQPSSFLDVMAQAMRQDLEAFIEKTAQTANWGQLAYDRAVALEKLLRSIELKITALGSRPHTPEDRGDLLAEINSMVKSALTRKEVRHG